MNQELNNNHYNNILRHIITEIKSTRVIVANRVNSSIIEMYWNIGNRLSNEGLEKGYGSSVVKRLSIDLKDEFPDAGGFSPRNLWEMKRFYELYDANEKLRQLAAVLPDKEKLQQAAAVLPDKEKLRQAAAVFVEGKKMPELVALLSWGHHLLILNKIKNQEEALYYVKSAVEMGWTRDILLNFIKADTYRNAKVLPQTHNFKKTLPENLQEQANEILKSTYNLGFLGITQPIKERELEKRLVEKIKLFLLELGNGFAFIGNQYRLTALNRKEYFVDLLFFNRKLKSLVAIDLKISGFEPEYIGKMNYYLGLLDDQLKMPDENPSVGILFCAEKEHVDVEVALRDINKPIGVADYHLQFPTDELKALITRELKESMKNKYF
jgi:predicted nuclease of restriction endonuclease-like (RecB) superfamily